MKSVKNAKERKDHNCPNVLACSVLLSLFQAFRFSDAKRRAMLLRFFRVTPPLSDECLVQFWPLSVTQRYREGPELDYRYLRRGRYFRGRPGPRGGRYFRDLQTTMKIYRYFCNFAVNPISRRSLMQMTFLCLISI